MEYKPLLICEQCRRYTRHARTGELIRRHRALFQCGCIVQQQNAMIDLTEYECGRCGAKRGYGSL
jgi:hypothetical protein